MARPRTRRINLARKNPGIRAGKTRGASGAVMNNLMVPRSVCDEFLTYVHTWTGGDIQGDTADMSGTDSFITFPSADAFDIADGDFTIEIILEWDAFPVALPHFFAKWGASGARSFSFWYRNDLNQLVFSRTINGSSILNVTASFSPSTSQVYHIAYCRNGADLRIFVDGAQVGSTGNVGTDDIFTTTSRLTIGNYDAAFESIIIKTFF